MTHRAVRNRAIFGLYRDGWALQDIGEAHGLTRERIRQIVRRQMVKRGLVCEPRAVGVPRSVRRVSEFFESAGLTDMSGPRRLKVYGIVPREMHGVRYITKAQEAQFHAREKKGYRCGRCGRKSVMYSRPYKYGWCSACIDAHKSEHPVLGEKARQYARGHYRRHKNGRP